MGGERLGITPVLGFQKRGPDELQWEQQQKRETAGGGVRHVGHSKSPGREQGSCHTALTSLPSSE